MRTNPSAAPSEKAKGGSVRGSCQSSFVFSAMRRTLGHDARSYRQDAATLFNSLDRKFHFPLNQDTSKMARSSEPSGR